MKSPARNMKQYIFFLFFLTFWTENFAQSIDFQPSLSAAFAKAKAQNKLVFVEYYNAECHVCKKLEPLLSDTSMRFFYDKNFVNYRLNTLNIKKEDQDFMDSSGLKPVSVPIFLFFDKNQKFVHFSHTQPEVKYLLEIGETALDPNERTENLENKYQKGDRSIRTLYAYSNLAQLYKKDSLVNLLSDDLFKSFPTANLGNKKSYTITKNCVTSIENGFFQFWINNLDKLKNFETDRRKDKEKEVLGNILTLSINSPASKKWDLEKIQAVKTMITKVELSDNPDVFLWQQEAKLFWKVKKNEDAMALCKRLLEHPKTDFNAAIYYLTFFAENSSDPKNLTVLQQYLQKQTPQNEDEKAVFEKTKIKLGLKN